MQGRGGKARACGVSMQGGYVYIADHLRLGRSRGYIWKSRGPRPGNGIRGPLLHCARVAFVGVSSDGHPTVSPPDRAQREQDEGRDQATRARTLAGQIGRRAPHGRPAGASGLNVAPRPARLCPHTHPHTHPHTRPQRATPQRPILRWHQDAPTPGCAPPTRPSAPQGRPIPAGGTRLPHTPGSPPREV